jgi:hypothetical protein
VFPVRGDGDLDGVTPTATVAITVLVAVSITETVLGALLAILGHQASLFFLAGQKRPLTLPGGTFYRPSDESAARRRRRPLSRNFRFLLTQLKGAGYAAKIATQLLGTRWEKERYTNADLL